MSKIKINVNRLQKGLYIELPVSWNEHPFLFSRFLIKDDKQLAILQQLNLPYVVIHTDKSKVTPLPPEQPPQTPKQEETGELEKLEESLQEEKQRSIDEMQGYRRRLDQCEEQFNQSISMVHHFVNKLPKRPLEAIGEADEMISNMTDSLLATDDLVLHLVTAPADEDSSHLHGLNVSVLAMMLGKARNLDQEQIHQLGMAGMLHDIGKLKIPKHVLTDKKLKESKRRYLIEKHPDFSLEFLRLLPDIHPVLLTLIAQHHEFADGSGYPKGLTADELHPLSLALSLINYYDNLCHPDESAQMAGTKALMPSQALSQIFKKDKNLFDNQDIAQLVRTLGVYPPGTIVKLSDEQIGIVISVNSQQLLFPKVMLFDAKIPRDQAPIIDLGQEQLKIEGAVNPAKLPKNIYNYLNPRSRVNFFFEQLDINKAIDGLNIKKS